MYGRGNKATFRLQHGLGENDRFTGVGGEEALRNAFNMCHVSRMKTMRLVTLDNIGPESQFGLRAQSSL